MIYAELNKLIDLIGHNWNEIKDNRKAVIELNNKLDMVNEALNMVIKNQNILIKHSGLEYFKTKQGKMN